MNNLNRINKYISWIYTITKNSPALKRNQNAIQHYLLFRPSLQLPPNLRVSCRVAPRTVQLGVVRTGGVEIVLLIINRFYSDVSIGF